MKPNTIANVCFVILGEATKAGHDGLSADDMAVGLATMRKIASAQDKRLPNTISKLAALPDRQRQRAIARALARDERFRFDAHCKLWNLARGVLP